MRLENTGKDQRWLRADGADCHHVFVSCFRAATRPKPAVQISVQCEAEHIVYISEAHQEWLKSGWCSTEENDSGVWILTQPLWKEPINTGQTTEWPVEILATDSSTDFAGFCQHEALQSIRRFQAGELKVFPGTSKSKMAANKFQWSCAAIKFLTLASSGLLSIFRVSLFTMAFKVTNQNTWAEGHSLTHQDIKANQNKQRHSRHCDATLRRNSFLVTFWPLSFLPLE